MKTLKKMMRRLDLAYKQCFKPLIPLKVANGSLALEIETVPGQVRLPLVGWGQSDL